ncbi:DUF4232 domain-containing protein [Actinoplanes sp. TBRC 11911]|uniref:DUF4232 domain-containing protein n=1 Tax=Actinoplanes sp. TBRC 11911 TaxID=2729386 RepID=UPI00145F7BDE|nr:DUF4232 domain-containing protein [Actinoplanes sp. TBRC 11911]NMO52621.1 DUF4232 domain-containing protein [Actinoplanes sp. TBRC 11911]
MKRIAVLLIPATVLALAACTHTVRPTAAATTTTTPTSTASSPTESPGRCHTADLSLTLGRGSAAAGTQHQFLVFTNKSGQPCTLYGYPGVSWVAGDQGTQVNDPFQRIDPDHRTHLTLAPGQQANAVLVTHTAENYPAATCKPVPVRGFRVYPPDETAAVFVAQASTACSVHGVGLAQVQPLTAGPGSE